jgi:hypothetical protein
VGAFHQAGMTSGLLGLHRRFQIRRDRESILDVVVESLEDVRGCDPEQHGRYPAKTIGQILYWHKPCELIDVDTH